MYSALDYSLSEEEQCQLSEELEELIASMTTEGKRVICYLLEKQHLSMELLLIAESDDEEEGVDEGIDEGFKRWDDEEERCPPVQEFDVILQVG